MFWDLTNIINYMSVLHHPAALTFTTYVLTQTSVRMIPWHFRVSIEWWLAKFTEIPKGIVHAVITNSILFGLIVSAASRMIVTFTRYVMKEQKEKIASWTELSIVF